MEEEHGICQNLKRCTCVRLFFVLYFLLRYLFSEGISTITNRLKDVKFHLYKFDIENQNNKIVSISIEFDKKLSACFSIFNEKFEEYDDIVHI